MLLLLLLLLLAGGGPRAHARPLRRCYVRMQACSPCPLPSLGGCCCCSGSQWGSAMLLLLLLQSSGGPRARARPLRRCYLRTCMYARCPCPLAARGGCCCCCGSQWGSALLLLLLGSGGPRAHARPLRRCYVRTRMHARCP